MTQYVYLSTKPLLRGENGELLVESTTRFNLRGEMNPDTDDFESFRRLVDTRQDLLAVLVNEPVGERGVPPKSLGLNTVDTLQA